MIKFYYSSPDILFVGINPHPGSASRGVPFSNLKMFWYLLSDAKLLPYTREQLKDDVFLLDMYTNDFNKTHKLGLINMIDRPSVDVSTLIKDEEAEGRKRLIKIIKKEKPKVVCFVGKITFQKFINHKDVDFGWQSNIESSKVFVMHAPHRGAAKVRIDELKLVAKAAK